VQHAIKVTLEEIYNGKLSKIAINRNKIEKKEGEKDVTCPACKGRGIVTKMQMIGPGMYS